MFGRVSTWMLQSHTHPSPLQVFTPVSLSLAVLFKMTAPSTSLPGLLFCFCRHSTYNQDIPYTFLIYLFLPNENVSSTKAETFVFGWFTASWAPLTTPQPVPNSCSQSVLQGSLVGGLFWGVCEVKTIFMIILGYYLLSCSHSVRSAQGSISGACDGDVAANWVRSSFKNPPVWDFPGGTVVESPPANAGDTGSSPDPGRSHMPWSNERSPCTTTTESAL